VRVALTAAAAVVCATLVDDALQPSILSHERSLPLYGLAVVLAAAMLVLAPRAGSRAVSAGAGIAAGGALATPLAALVWDGGVPNPLVRGDVAFNVADVAIALGVALLVAGALLHAWLHRDRLHEPV
jgi:lipoprotein signal peptidase